MRILVTLRLLIALNAIAYNYHYYNKGYKHTDDRNLHIQTRIIDLAIRLLNTNKEFEDLGYMLTRRVL